MQNAELVRTGGLMVVGFGGEEWRVEGGGGRFIGDYWELTGNCQRLMGLMGVRGS